MATTDEARRALDRAGSLESWIEGSPLVEIELT
jgi:hypothetical protein